MWALQVARGGFVGALRASSYVLPVPLEVCRVIVGIAILLDAATIGRHGSISASYIPNSAENPLRLILWRRGWHLRLPSVRNKRQSSAGRGWTG